VPQSFEPNVGANTVEFVARERVLQSQLRGGCERTLRYRRLVEVQSVGGDAALRAFVQDDSMPPGKQIALTYSYVNNDIRTQWVGGDLWRWFWPDALRVQSAPVMTLSSSPYEVQGCFSGGALYVFAISHDLAVPDLHAINISANAPGSYRWWRVALPSRICDVPLQLRAPAALAHVVWSPSLSWTPRRVNARPANAPVQGYASAVWVAPWKISGTLHDAAANTTLVLAQRYSAHWRLRLAGIDEGNATRVNAIMNGWHIPVRYGNVQFVVYDDREAGALRICLAVLGIYALGAAICIGNALRVKDS
jgi:hypothetical protein